MNYDNERDRSDLVHQGKITLDIPGKALDAISETDLHLFLLGLRQFNPACTRCDVFFDDYERNITPEALKKITDKKNYSGFREINMKQQKHPNPEYTREWRRTKKKPRKIKPMITTHDEIDFGRRGQNGCGKYLRVYDKNLESKGEKNCIRWEIEFSKERAHVVFDKLSQAPSIKAFAALCGSLIAGAIVFVHRYSEKNVGRMRIYNFWQQIIDLLGKVVIRVPTKESDIDGMHQFIYKQVSPTLACLRDTFTSDSDFYCWLIDVLAEGELRMSRRQINIAKVNKRTLRYSDGKVFDNIGEILNEF